jgi:hypothetical protein
MVNYNFTHIAEIAIKKYVDGCATLELMAHAQSETEKAEIALVCLLDLDDNKVVDLKLCCQHAQKCAMINCREKLRLIIEDALVRRN